MDRSQNDFSGETMHLYAWIAPDLQGVEGIITIPTNDGILPLVVADERRARRFQPAAAYAAKERGATARLIRFDRAVVIAEAAP